MYQVPSALSFDAIVAVPKAPAGIKAGDWSMA